MSKPSHAQTNDSQDESPPIVHPEIQLIDGLFQKIERGKLRIPAFQRPFVWKADDMLKLFESIQKGYPIGSLLLWETSGDYQSRPDIGPIKLPTQPEKPITYILDGQQRLSTLFGTLRLPETLAQNSDPALRIWRIYYDLESERFSHARNPAAPIPAHFLPLRALLKTSDFLRYSRILSEQLKDRSEVLLQRAERLVQQVASYRFSVTRIEGGSLAAAVEIFSRLNSRGRPMQSDEMVSALTYKEGSGGFHLASRIDEIIDNLTPLGFGEMSRVLIFRTIIAATGQSVIQQDWMRAVKTLGNSLAATVDRAERAMKQAASLLTTQMGLPGEPLLPYSYQFVLLAHFYGHCEKLNKEITTEHITLFTRWFWATSFSGWFAGANSNQIKEALDAMEAFATDASSVPDLFTEQLRQPARPFPEQFDLHSARARVLILTVLTRLHPRRLSGEPLEQNYALWSRRQRHLQRIFGNQPAHLNASPANRLFLPSDISAVFGPRRLIELPINIREQVLSSHGIVGEAVEALLTKNAPAFIKARTQYLAKLERDFMAELDLTPPTALVGPTEIDTGDDE